VLDCFEQEQSTHASCLKGEVHLVRRVAGYKKIRYYTHENVGYGDIKLPDQEMHTTAVWWQVRPDHLESAFPDRWLALDGFLGAAHALHLVAILLTMSERRDLGRAVGDSDGTWSAVLDADGRSRPHSPTGAPLAMEQVPAAFRPTVYLYDNYPGGVGLSAPLYDMRAQVAGGALDLVNACDCSHGCPACVGPVLARDENRMLSPRAAAIKVLSLLTAQEAH
jgi:DEAD/DEAH box helicase domain-containing protein